MCRIHRMNFYIVTNVYYRILLLAIKNETQVSDNIRFLKNLSQNRCEIMPINFPSRGVFIRGRRRNWRIRRVTHERQKFADVGRHRRSQRNVALVT